MLTLENVQNYSKSNNIIVGVFNIKLILDKENIFLGEIAYDLSCD